MDQIGQQCDRVREDMLVIAMVIVVDLVVVRLFVDDDWMQAPL